MSLPPAATERFAIGVTYLKTRWRTSIIFFFVVFAFFLGLAFVISPILTNRVTYGGWHRWGDTGLVVFGCTFMALSLWSVFWPDGPGGVLTTSVLSLIGLVTSVPPANAYWSIAGIIFYSLILGTLFTPVAQERFDTLFTPRPGRAEGGDRAGFPAADADIHRHQPRCIPGGDGEHRAAILRMGLSEQTLTLPRSRQSTGGPREGGGFFVSIERGTGEDDRHSRRGALRARHAPADRPHGRAGRD